MNVEIAQRLAEMRRKKGYSQEELAEKLGLSRQAVSKWERAESSPDTDNLIALARLYGTSLDELLAIEPIIEDDVAFETIDRAQEEQATLDAQVAQATQVAQVAQVTPAEQFAQVAQTFPPPPPAYPQVPEQPFGESTYQDGYSYPQAPEQPYWDGTYEDGYPYPQAPEQPYWEDQPPVVHPPRVRSPLMTFPYPVAVVVIYLFIGFFFGLWHPGWILFLTIPFYYWIASIVHRDLNRNGNRS